MLITSDLAFTGSRRDGSVFEEDGMQDAGTSEERMPRCSKRYTFESHQRTEDMVEEQEYRERR